MYTVIKQIKRFLAVFSALFITLVTTKVRGHQTCGPEEFAQCAKPLSVLTDSGLTFVSSKADLDRICPDLKEAIKCIHTYTRLCMMLNHRRHFKKLFNGTGAMVHELCRNGTYQDEYLRHAPCMKEVSGENEVCFKGFSTKMTQIQSKTAAEQQNSSNPDLIYFQKRKREAADEGIKSVCCSYQEYVECSTHTMRRHCGEDAAEFSRNFLDRMASSMIKMHCSLYGTKECGISSASKYFSFPIHLAAILTAVVFLI